MPGRQQPPEPAESVNEAGGWPRRWGRGQPSSPYTPHDGGLLPHVAAMARPAAQVSWRRSPWRAGQTATAVPSTDAAPSDHSSLAAAHLRPAQLGIKLSHQRPALQLSQTQAASGHRRQGVLLGEGRRNRPPRCARSPPTDARPAGRSDPRAMCPSSATTRPAWQARAYWMTSISNIGPPSTPSRIPTWLRTGTISSHRRRASSGKCSGGSKSAGRPSRTTGSGSGRRPGFPSRRFSSTGFRVRRSRHSRRLAQGL